MVSSTEFLEITPNSALVLKLDEGDWKYKVIKLYSTDITPIDRESPSYKWIKDMDANDNHTEES